MKKAPSILFTKESAHIDLMLQSGASVLSVGSCVDLAKARKKDPGIIFQGNVDNQIIGVFGNDVLNIYKEVFNKREGKNAFIILGYEGMDEISTEGENFIYSNVYGEKIFNPVDLKLKEPIKSELIGDDPNYNANRIIDIFTGKKDSFYEIVSINAAFAFLLSSNEEPNTRNINKYYELARSIIDTGSAENKLKDLISFSNK